VWAVVTEKLASVTNNALTQKFNAKLLEQLAEVNDSRTGLITANFLYEFIFRFCFFVIKP